MENLEQVLKEYSSKPLETRKSWYSPAAIAYDQARPRYPSALIERVVEITKLTSQAEILEIGPGPAIATLPFALKGYKIQSLEPNLDFVHLAQKTCETYPNVEIKNISFEEWQLESEKFDVVLAASSFHWISQEVACYKAAAALKKDGYLILLWNSELQPQWELSQSLSEVYQKYAPSIHRYENNQKAFLEKLGELLIDLAYFQDPVFEMMETEVTYSVDDYLTLLTTYSDYLKLESQQRETLFTGLRQKIEQSYGSSLELVRISAFHLARKKA